MGTVATRSAEPFSPTAFDLNEFNRNLRSSENMTCEHLRPLLPDVRGMLFQISQRMARGQVPEVINIGDVRRLVARTMSQQLSPAVETSHQPASICHDDTGRVRVCGARVARVDGNRPTSGSHVH